MNTEKLELKHLAAYLPYDLLVHSTYNGRTEKVIGLTKNVVMTVKADCENPVVWNPTYEEIKPYLRPLSQLTETITHNGETFVPVEKLIKDFTGGGDGMELTFYPDGCYFYAYRNGIHCIVPQGEMIEKLYEWHFDVTGSILSSNLALPLKD